MAEAINYRMNLVIDPKNVIKANRELRAMERYFERIQGRVLKIGRTRMAPEIVLKDYASKSLDGLLAKINRVKSQVIEASANVNMNVKQTAGQMDFSPLIQALQGNTNALLGLTNALGTLGTVKEEKPKAIWDKIKDGFGAAKSVGGGVKNVSEIPEKVQAIGDAWQGKTDNKCCCTGGIMARRKGKGTVAGGSKKGKSSGGKGTNFDIGEDTKTPSRIETRGRKRGRLRKTAGAAGALIETIGSAGEGLIGGFQSIGKLIGGKSDSSAIASSVPKGLGKGSGIVASAAKGIGKRLLGPLSFVADAASIATAAPGKERAQAIGSAVGGGAGAAIGGLIGSIIPGAGTLVGSALGGAAGSWLGEKAGGLISDAGGKIKEGFSKASDWFSSKFSFGKKKKPIEDIADKPAIIASPSAAPAPAIPPAQVPAAPVHSHSSSRGSFGAPVNSFGPPLPYNELPPYNTGSRMQTATNSNPTSAGGKMTPQVVQISPEQMSTLSGFLRDFKTENTMNYNLPPGAVQVTVHEEHPVDIEGLILQIGQRLRAEFSKAAQNRKPGPMAY